MGDDVGLTSRQRRWLISRFRRMHRWYLHTVRENYGDTPPRIVMFDDAGRRVWSAVDRGHIDTGWCARIGPGGEPVVLGVRIDKKLRSGAGERRRDGDRET